jgi:hypothetical protein
MKFSFSALFLLAPFFLFSQKFNVRSIIITKTNDTLHLLTADRELRSPSSVKTMDSASKEYRTYRASEISELIIETDDFYRSAVVTVDRTPYNEEIAINKFAQKQSIDTVLLKTEYTSNNIKLYSLYDKKRSHFFIQKDNDTIAELIYRKLLLNRNGTIYENEDKKFISQLSDLLADCPEAVSGINYIGYTTQAIEKVFNNYNSLCHKSNVARYRKTYKAKFEISALAGVSLITFSDKEYGFIGGPTITKLSSGVSPIVGARFNYIPAILHYNLSIAGDLYYNTFTASGSYYSNFISNTDYTRNTIQFKDQYLNLSIVVRYYILSEKNAFRPFVNVGYLAGYVVSPQNKVTMDDFFNGTHTITESDYYPNNGFAKYHIAYIGGIGIIYKKWSIDYRYSGYPNVLYYTTRFLTATSSNITLAYKLNK